VGVIEDFREFCVAQNLADFRSFDLDANVAAYIKWKDERDEQRSKSSEKSTIDDQ
jgi:hypothetical protein